MQIFDFILGLPVLVKVLGSLALILGLNAKTRQLLLSIVVGTVVLALWSGHSISAAAAITWDRLASMNNSALLLVTFMVIWLSTQMSETGVMRELVLAVRERVPHRAAFALLPAVIGFLPMPGGAVFSAPLVDDCDHEKTLDPLHKTQINYWFRHVWEYWWPLYPGVLLALEITGLPLWKFMLLQIPLAGISILVGTVFLLRRIPTEQKNTNDEAATETAPTRPILPLLAPIIAVVLVYALACLPGLELQKVNRYLPLLFGLVIAMGMLQTQRRLTWPQWRKILFAKKTLVLAGMVAAIRVYGAFIEARLPDGTLLVTAMQDDFQAWGLSAIVVIALLPFIAGLTTGLAIGFVGISLPVAVSLLGVDPAPARLMATTALAYGFGYMGMILSPVHICLLVTNKHFRTSLIHSIASLAKPAGTVLLGVVGYYLLLRALL